MLGNDEEQIEEVLEETPENKKKADIPATDGVETPFNDPSAGLTTDQLQVKHSEDFLNDQDVLSPEQLYELAADNNPEAREMLMALAEKYDIPLAGDFDARMVVETIVVAMDSQDSNGVNNE